MKPLDREQDQVTSRRARLMVRSVNEMQGVFGEKRLKAAIEKRWTAAAFRALRIEVDLQRRSLSRQIGISSQELFEFEGGYVPDKKHKEIREKLIEFNHDRYSTGNAAMMDRFTNLDAKKRARATSRRLSTSKK